MTSWRPISPPFSININDSVILKGWFLLPFLGLLPCFILCQTKKVQLLMRSNPGRMRSPLTHVQTSLPHRVNSNNTSRECDAAHTQRRSYFPTASFHKHRQQLVSEARSFVPVRPEQNILRTHSNTGTQVYLHTVIFTEILSCHLSSFHFKEQLLSMQTSIHYTCTNLHDLTKLPITK